MTSPTPDAYTPCAACPAVFWPPHESGLCSQCRERDGGALIQFPGEPPMPFSQRPDGPECECTEDRDLLPCDWGWRCAGCGLPVPRTNTS